MNFLIDTHVLLWHMTDDPRLKKKYSDAIGDEKNEIFVSKATLWEVAIKVSINKLTLTKPILEWKNYFLDEFFLELDIDHQDFNTLSQLPFHHNDPFDRLIICQAMTRNFTIITDDKKFQLYPVQLL